jgi:hypothetical protein
MSASIYKSKAVGYFLISYLSILLIWKTLLTLAYADLFALLPMLLQLIIIVLLVLEHRLTRLVLSIWVVFFILIGQGIVIIGKLLASANGDLSYLTSPMFAFNVFQFLIGWFMLYLCKKHFREE